VSLGSWGPHCCKGASEESRPLRLDSKAEGGASTMADANKTPAAEKEAKSPPPADSQKREENPSEPQTSEQKLPTSSESSLKSPGTQSPSERYHGGRRILCAFDGSDGSRAAFIFVREKLATLGDSIILFQALEPIDRET
jgi:hypothetical protein